MDEAAAKFSNTKYQIPNERMFPVPLLEKDSLDFSFSGLKSAALREIQSRKGEKAELSEEDIQELCWEYRESVTLVLIEKLFRAVQQYDVTNIYLV